MEGLPLTHKTCRDCDVVLTDENWTESRRRKRMYRCTDCENKKLRSYRNDNVTMRLWSSVKSRAKRLGLPFDLEPADIVVPTHCPILGSPIDTSYSKRTDNSPSVDRAVPERGYVKGNVIVISWRANRLKSDASLDELRRIASFYQQFVPLVGENDVQEASRVVHAAVA